LGAVPVQVAHFCLPGSKSVGAVVQPRDNSPKAAYATYDLHERTVELRRLAYDIVTTQKKIRDAGLGA